MHPDTFFETYMQQAESQVQPVHGMRGTESDWLMVGDLGAPTGKLALADVQFLPYLEDRLVVEVEPGTYSVDIKLLAYGNAFCISRLRLIREGSSPFAPTDVLGTTWVDTGLSGICDAGELDAVISRDSDQAWYALVEAVQEVDLLKSSEFSGVEVLVVAPGFGDGEYDVRELISGERRVGLEVEFLPADTPYAFY